MNEPKNPHLLIDGDIFLYRCGFAVEKTKYLVTKPLSIVGGESVSIEYFDTAKEAKAVEGGVVWSRKEVEPVEHALEATKNALNEVFDRFWPNKGTWDGDIFLSGRNNFREAIFAGGAIYKDNRDPAHRPKHYKAIKEFLISKYKATVINGMEADDAIGCAAYRMRTDEFVVVSNDKDLDQISGFHYDWTKRELYYVDDEDAIKTFYVQLLAGDATDNIKGATSLAEARKIIEGCRNPSECAKAAGEIYKKKYGDTWDSKLDATANLVWIRHGSLPDPGYAAHPFWRHFSVEG